MTPEEFRKLKQGDIVQWHNHVAEVSYVETQWNYEAKEQYTWQAHLDNGSTIRETDRHVDEIRIIRRPNPSGGTRVELVIHDIDSKSRGWTMMLEAIESAIEHYGGTVTEVNVED